MQRKSIVSLAVFLGVLLGSFPSAHAAEHMYNGDMSIAGSTDVLVGVDANGRPDGWLPGGRGDNSRSYIYGDWAQHTGPATKMAKVKIYRYVNGNASWISDDMPVNAGQTYVLTHKYRSDVTSTLGLRYKINGVYSYQWLNTFPATNTWLPVPVRRRFTVPAGATHVAVYRSIAGIGYLEVGRFSLVDPADVDVPDPNNMIRNSSLLEVDKNNEPVGWKHMSSNGLFRGYRWHPCSVEQSRPMPSNPRTCPHETGNYISVGTPGGDDKEVEASWYTEDVALPPPVGADPRNLVVTYLVAARPEPYTRIRYTMSDGTKIKKTIGIVNTEQDDLWGGPAQVSTEVPAGAVSFSLFLSMWSSSFSDEGRSKWADIKVRYVDPGQQLSDPGFVP